MTKPDPGRRSCPWTVPRTGTPFRHSWSHCFPPPFRAPDRLWPRLSTEPVPTCFACKLPPDPEGRFPNRSANRLPDP